MKRFRDWMVLKEKLHKIGRVRTISEGEVWWCAMGENIGVEINGKGKIFARPILIFRKLNRYSFIGIPLTSQAHSGSWYVGFRFQNTEETAVLVQVRLVSVFRVYNKMGRIDEADMAKIKKGFHNLLCR